MTDRRSHLDPLAMAILVVLCASWGVQQVTVKLALAGVPPLLQSGLRSIVAVALLWLWMAARKVPLFERDGSLVPGILAGLLFAGEFLLIYQGLVHTTASRAVIFLYTSPFVVALGAHLFVPGETLGRTQTVGLACAFAGILVAFGDALNFPSWEQLVGDVMLLGAAVLWGATTVLIKASRLTAIAPSKTLFYQLGVSALVLPAASLAVGEPSPGPWTPVIVASLVYQSVWVAFATYLTWFWLIRHYPTARVASFTFLTPLFGVMAGAAMLGEPLSRSLLLALALVALGINLVNRKPRPAVSTRGKTI